MASCKNKLEIQKSQANIFYYSFNNHHYSPITPQNCHWCYNTKKQDLTAKQELGYSYIKDTIKGSICELHYFMITDHIPDSESKGGINP